MNPINPETIHETHEIPAYSGTLLSPMEFVETDGLTSPDDTGSNPEDDVVVDPPHEVIASAGALAGRQQLEVAPPDEPAESGIPAEQQEHFEPTADAPPPVADHGSVPPPIPPSGDVPAASGGEGPEREPVRYGRTLPEGSLVEFDHTIGVNGAWREVVSPAVFDFADDMIDEGVEIADRELFGVSDTIVPIEVGSMVAAASDTGENIDLSAVVRDTLDSRSVVVSFYQPSTGEGAIANLDGQPGITEHNLQRLESLQQRIPALQESDTIVEILSGDPPPTEADVERDMAQVVQDYLNTRYTFPANWADDREGLPPPVRITYDVGGCLANLDTGDGVLTVENINGTVEHYVDPRAPRHRE